MEAPPRARSYVPLPIQQTGAGVALSLFAAQGVPTPALSANARPNAVPIVRLKRKVDSDVRTISVERTVKKALHEELAALAVAEKKEAPNAAPDAKPAPSTPSTPQRKLYRRVASFSARAFQNVQGAENLLERIYIKSEDVALREAMRTDQRKRQDEQRDRAKQRQTAARRQQQPTPTEPIAPPASAPKAPTAVLPVSKGTHPTRQQLEADEQRLLMNYMPLVREYLQIEKQKAEEAAKQKLAEEQKRDVEMGGVLDEYVVDIYEEVPDEDAMEQAEATVMLYDNHGDPLLFDWEESNNDGDSEDSNAEDHPDNDYPDEPDYEDDEDDSSAEKDSDVSSDEDIWRPSSRRLERYVQEDDSD